MEKIANYYPHISLIGSILSVLFLSLSLNLWLKLRKVRENYSTLIGEKELLGKQFNDLDKWRLETEEKIPAWENALNMINQFDNLTNEIELRSNKLKELTTNLKDEKQELSKLKEEVGELRYYVELEENGVFTYKFKFQDIKKYEQAFEALKIALKRYPKEGHFFDDSKSSLKGTPILKALEKLALKAFNGNADLISNNVKFNNFDSCQDKMKKLYEFINTQLVPFKCQVTEKYFRAKSKELALAFEYEEEKQRIKEEQDEIRAQMREEQKNIQEAERKRDRAIEEEEKIEAALEIARNEILSKTESERNEFEIRIKELERQLLAAHENTERAISNAQITSVGHVYIISNLGSFGDNIFKIGMTRRDDPLDRVRELGDASVPFKFDVHAMVYSENARTLEADLHHYFNEQRVNKVNKRKEFFNVTLDEIGKACDELGYDVKLTKLAEAREFREGLVIEEEAA